MEFAERLRRAERPAGRHSPDGGGVVLEEFPGALEDDARDAETR